MMIYSNQESMTMHRLQSHNGTIASSGVEGRSDSIMEPLAKMRKLGISDFDASDGSLSADTLSSSCSSLFSQQNQNQPQHQVLPSCDEKMPASRITCLPSCSGTNNMNKRKRPNQSVRFSQTSHVVVLPAREDDESELCWYSKADLAGFKRQMRDGAARLRHTRTARSMKHVAYLAATAATSNGTNRDGGNGSSGTSSGRQQPLLPTALPEAIRGMEHLLCPTVCRLLMQRRRMVVDRVLEEQHRLIMEEEATFKSTSNQDMDVADAAMAVRIARVSVKNSSFSKEWCRRITMLHDPQEQR